MRSCLRWAALTITALFGCAPVYADDLYLPEIERIIDKGTLMIGVTSADIPPMIARKADGGLSGFDIDLARDIAAALGVRAQFVIAGTHRELIAAVAQGHADIAVSNLSLTVEDAKRVYFTTPYLIQPLTLMLNRKKGAKYSRYCPSLADAEELLRVPGEIGIRRESQYESLISARFPDAVPRTYDTVSSLLNAVLRGDILASLQGEVVAKNFLLENPQASIHLKLCSIGTEAEQFAVAVRPDAPDLLRWLDIYLRLRGVIIDADRIIYRDSRIK